MDRWREERDREGEELGEKKRVEGVGCDAVVTQELSTFLLVSLTRGVVFHRVSSGGGGDGRERMTQVPQSLTRLRLFCHLLLSFELFTSCLVRSLLAALME